MKVKFKLYFLKVFHICQFISCWWKRWFALTWKQFLPVGSPFCAFLPATSWALNWCQIGRIKCPCAISDLGGVESIMLYCDLLTLVIATCCYHHTVATAPHQAAANLTFGPRRSLLSIEYSCMFDFYFIVYFSWVHTGVLMIWLQNNTSARALLLNPIIVGSLGRS